MYINYEYYRIFYCVAKCRNFTQAAEMLMNNQPNITRTIKNLESELGCSLFIRSNRGVKLTAEGERLFAHISAAVEHITAGEEEILLEKTLQKGSISIGTSEIALRCFLLPVLKKFRSEHPNIKLKIHNFTTPQALSELKNGLIDIAFVTTPLGETNGLNYSEIKEIQEAAVCGAAFGKLCESVITLSELAEYPLISLGERTMTYELYSDWFRSNGCKFKPDIEAETADQILPMVINDLGVGFVPEDFLDDYSGARSIRRLKLSEDIPKRSICFVKRTDQTLSLATKELERMILHK